MTRIGSAGVVAAALALLVGSFALAGGEDPPRPADGKSGIARTLARTEDYVVLTGQDLPQLVKRHKDQLRAFAARDGKLVAIPFQVDEKNGEGSYCWDKGDNIIKDDDGGVFDANDELCFLARDAGDKVEAASLLPSNCDGFHEVELTDPLDGKKGWVYLAKFYGKPPALSPVRYVSIEKGDDGIIVWKGDRFLTSNAKTPENACRATIIQFAPEGTTDPTKGTNIIDCSKVTLVAYWTFISVTRTGADVRIQLGGYIAGPIRIVAQNLVEVKLALGIWLSAPDSLLTLYPNCTTMPTNVKVPVSLNESDPSCYKLPIDLSQRVKGWKFFNDRNPDPVTIDGKMDAKEQAMDLTFPSWNCAYGPEGALITRFTLDPRCVKPTNKLLYVDDLTQVIEPEFEPGSFGTFGYYVDLAGIKSGMYSGNYYIFYAPPPFKPGDQKKYIDTLDNPLKVAVR